MGLRFAKWLWLTCATISLLRAEAGSIDVILDDADDSIQYIPANGWTRGELCVGCLAKPDPSLAREGTWSDTTHHPGDAETRIVATRFTGTAVSVYCILANYIQWVDTMTNLSFVLDGAAGDGDDGGNASRGHLVSYNPRIIYTFPIHQLHSVES